MKKHLLTLGAAATALAPIATVVSCGTTNEVRFWFSLTSTYRDSMRKLVTEYNENHKEDGIYPVNLVSISGSYSAIGSNLENYLQTNNTKRMPGLAFGYNDALALAANRGKALDLGYDSTTDTGIKRSIFNETFVKMQDQIEGITPGTLHSVPAAKSTDLLYINGPVMKYMIQEMEKEGATISSTGTINNIATNIALNGDLAWIRRQKRFDLKNTTPASRLSGYTIDDSIFTSMTSIYEFTKKSKEIFNMSAKEFTFGSDPSTNYFYNMAYSMGDADIENFYFSLDSTSKEMGYRFGKTSTNAYKVFEQLYNGWKDAVENGSMTQKGGGAFSSTTLIPHEMAISIGSSAGYSKNYGGDTTNELSKNELYVLPAPTIYGEPAASGTTATNSTLIQGPSLFGIKNNSQTDKSSRAFATWLYKENVKLFEGETDEFTGRPIEWWTGKNNYIVPTNEFLDGAKPSTLNAAQSVVFDSLQKIKNDPDYNAFENPANKFTSAIRTNIANNLRNSFKSFDIEKDPSKKSTWSFAQFLTNLRDSDKSGENIFK